MAESGAIQRSDAFIAAQSQSAVFPAQGHLSLFLLFFAANYQPSTSP
jgi:hypothetical protein